LANSSKALESLEAYGSAIDLYPTYVRARYNMSLSLVTLGRYDEAVKTILSALDIQQEHFSRLDVIGGDSRSLESLSSDSVWNMMGSILSGYLHRYDLVQHVRNKDLASLKDALLVL
jgi:peroxin-5